MALIIGAAIILKPFHQTTDGILMGRADITAKFVSMKCSLTPDFLFASLITITSPVIRQQRNVSF